MNTTNWEERWKDRRLGWDIGYPAPAIARYFEGEADKSARILIPGCGNAYEAEFLHQAGFTNVWVIDIAPSAIRSFLERFPKFPPAQAIAGDFFEHSGDYNYVIEQTFFCAIDPSIRPIYAEKMSKLIVPGGKLIGVVFDDPSLVNGPPFGGNAEDYKTFFAPFFYFDRYEKNKFSIPPRESKEYFMELRRK